MSYLQHKYKLRPSIAVTHDDEKKPNTIAFFKTDIRKSFILKVHDSKKIYDILFSFDGFLTLAQIIEKHTIPLENTEQLEKFVFTLNKEGILQKVDEDYNIAYENYFRVFHFLENYCSSRSELNIIFDKISKSKVMIIGLGGVGSWVAQSLLMNGVSNFILVDNDEVDISNLPRQASFFEKDIGSKKIDVIENRLSEINTNVKIEKIYDFLDKDFFVKHNIGEVDLIINCADKPTVDVNSLIVGEFCMKNNIPHIIGGGYNLHLSLLAHSVVPFQTACAKCLDIQLKELNVIKNTNIKKLQRERKIGSTLVHCTLSASVISMESIKILADLFTLLATNNIRKEFNIQTLEISEKIIFVKRKDCLWCGEYGIYKR